MAMKNLKAHRATAGKSAVEVSAYLGLTVHAYRRWERGEVEPKASQIVALARLFGVTTDRLLTERPDETGAQRMVLSIQPGQRVIVDVTGMPVEESPGYKPEVSLRDNAGLAKARKTKRA